MSEYLGIAGVGAYAPRFRLSSEEFADAWGSHAAAGVESVAVADADEDALTMAAEAGARALDAGDVDPAAVEELALASTTLPVEEEAQTPRLASLLGLPEGVSAGTYAGSANAGLDALVAVLDGDGPALVVASDTPRGSPDDAIGQGAGAGAAALVLTPDGDGALSTPASHAASFPGTRFRRRGAEEAEGLGVTAYDRDAYRTAVEGAVNALEGEGVDVEDVDAAALGAPNGGLPYRVAGDVGVSTDEVARGTTVHDLGDTGAASPLLGLASALTAGAERVLVAGYGAGATSTALVLDGRPPAEAALDGDIDLTYAEYLRRLGDLTSGEPSGGGAYVSLPSWARTVPQRHRLAAGRCTACGAFSLPPSGACPACGARDGYEDVELPGTGTVETATRVAAGGAPPEFAEYGQQTGAYTTCVVDLDTPDEDEGVSVPLMAIAGDEPAPGDRVRTVPRRIYTQEGVTRYGRKIALLD